MERRPDLAQAASAAQSAFANTRKRIDCLSEHERLGSFDVPKVSERAEDASALRRFGLALVRDERLVTDEPAAARLVDKLIRQSGVVPVAEGPETSERQKRERHGRVAAYARFVELYRRHVRRMTLDEEVSASEYSARGVGVACGVRALPLDLREALLLVGFARFAHAEAAQALDIPLPRLLERLERARCRVAAHMGVDLGATTWRGAAHLRVIK